MYYKVSEYYQEYKMDNGEIENWVVKVVFMPNNNVRYSAESEHHNVSWRDIAGHELDQAAVLENIFSEIEACVMYENI